MAELRSIPDWLRWARQIQAIAQTGLTFVKDPYDKQRYEALRALAAEIMESPCALFGARASVELSQQFVSGTGYATPKLDVRGAVFRDEPDGESAILLVKERSDGCWTLPGGWVDVGETPSQAVEKEVREESGYEVKAEKILSVWDRDAQGHPPYTHHVWKVFVRCRVIGGRLRCEGDGLETDGADFFRESQIPPLSLPRVLPSQVARLFEHHRNPALSADFD